MSEKPILFSGEMVRAILEGRKTMTRRVVKPPPFIVHRGEYDAWEWHHGPKGSFTTWKTSLDPLSFVGMAIERRPSPFGKVGDRLWVREAFSMWFTGAAHWYNVPRDRRIADRTINTFYRATHHFPDDDQRWVPSIFMPRWASRITLEITDVRVERLNQITEADAKAEGVCLIPPLPPRRHPHVQLFMRLWNSLNAKRGFGWDANPWVWIIKFKREKP